MTTAEREAFARNWKDIVSATALLMSRIGPVRLMIAGSLLGVLRSRVLSLSGARAAHSMM
jgi:hypothetical protein